MHESIKEALIRSILEWAQATLRVAAFQEPVIFVCIAYDPACEGFPAPKLCLGTERERQELAIAPLTQKRLARLGDLARQSFYNPANYSNFDTPLLKGEREQMDALGEEIAQDINCDWDDFYFALGRRMQAIQWQRWLHTTPDFVCYTTDIQLSTWDLIFASIVPHEIRRSLFSEGWIPSDVA